jgi:hypothetical protein
VICNDVMVDFRMYGRVLTAVLTVMELFLAYRDLRRATRMTAKAPGDDYVHLSP